MRESPPGRSESNTAVHTDDTYIPHTRAGARALALSASGASAAWPQSHALFRVPEPARDDAVDGLQRGVQEAPAVAQQLVHEKAERVAGELVRVDHRWVGLRSCVLGRTGTRAKIARSESHLVQQGGAQGAEQGWDQIGVGVVESAGLVSRGSWLCAEVVCGQRSRSKARSALASLSAGAPQTGSAPQCSDPMERFSGSFPPPAAQPPHQHAWNGAEERRGAGSVPSAGAPPLALAALRLLLLCLPFLI